MNSKERVLCALAGEQPDKIPFAEHQIAPSVLAVLFGEEKAKDSIYVADQMGLDILTCPVLPPLFVEETILPDGRSHITGGKLKNRNDLSLIASMENPTDPAIYKGLDELVARKGDRAVVGKTRLGLSSMLMSMDLTGFSMALADDPELIEIVLKRYVEWSSVAIEEMTIRGVDVIWCFDDIAYGSGPMMSPAVFRELLLPHLLAGASEISVPWIFHSDGDLRLVFDDLLTLGMSGMHPIEPESMCLGELKKQIGKRVCLVGNVSVDVLSRGTKRDVRKGVKRCIRDGGNSGYMISSSNSIPNYAKPENVMAMVENVRELRNTV